MLAVFAEFEREILRERVKAGIAQARAKGIVLGGRSPRRRRLRRFAASTAKKGSRNHRSPGVSASAGPPSADSSLRPNIAVINGNLPVLTANLDFPGGLREGDFAPTDGRIGEHAKNLAKLPITPFSGTTKTNWDCRWQDYFRLADHSGVGATRPRCRFRFS
jgi:hypothetical protein